MLKREKGQYYTIKNPFIHDEFTNWAKRSNICSNIILEPFAGANHIIKMLQDVDFCKDNYVSYDIEPKNQTVLLKDTISNFPQGYQIVVTNPPYLAKYSASRRHLDYPKTNYDDLYKHCLSICLQNTPYVAAIIPASFLNSGLFLDRLSVYIGLPYKDMFLDTECPVCLALFEPKVEKSLIYEKEIFLGELQDLKSYQPKPKLKNLSHKIESIIFNDKSGELGFIAIDNTHAPSIKFVKGDEIDQSKVKFSSRSITRIKVGKNVSNGLVDDLNCLVKNVRENTQDILLTPFKGIRKDGRFRRRMEYSFARDLILSL